MLKLAKVKKFRSTLKKAELVYQILDLQAANPDTIKPEVIKSATQPAEDTEPKPKRARVAPQKEVKAKTVTSIEKSKVEAPVEDSS